MPKKSKAQTELKENIIFEKNFRIEPIISEKSRKLAEEQNVYVFKIYPPKLNKTEIKQIIEKKFNVKVLEVRTINYGERRRGRTRIPNVRKKFKKAYVKLEKGYSLPIFE